MRPVGYTASQGGARAVGEGDNGHKALCPLSRQDGKPFIKDQRPGFLKFYACSGEHQGTYELQFRHDRGEAQAFVFAAEAYVLQQAGADALCRLAVARPILVHLCGEGTLVLLLAYHCIELP